MGKFFRFVVHRGLADAGAHIVDKDVQQSPELLFGL